MWLGQTADSRPKAMSPADVPLSCAVLRVDELSKVPLGAEVGEDGDIPGLGMLGRGRDRMSGAQARREVRFQIFQVYHSRKVR